jgi:hypothetical protein
MPKVTVQGFASNTLLKGHNKGLIKAKGKTSNVTITATGLTDSLQVDITNPKDTKHTWTGTTGKPADGKCTLDVTCVEARTSEGAAGSGSKDGDTAATVSVTVGDSTPTPFNTFTGDAP